ncbi:tetratricopeptide repeat domain protein [Synechococcus sp. PCC 7335]|uniref:CHAT domain-containing tetratricopeptide repeat protein n=1 Tax=Synechococcus sp. (strain ATCC 29403 / PCC 7335) TaxID=91464 RepID=UPI00017ECEB8|nr:CHAT domain-containing tetratricopeptide repeat protein [Synechococcus sp. PCC 7335]EDX83827.1 tetratricopeptide repeat domain protein [Synechococcus sp. PCC 7335]
MQQSDRNSALNTQSDSSVLIASESNAGLLFQQGEDAYWTGEFDKSRQLWQQALAAYEESGDRTQSAATLNKIAIAYRAVKEYPEALEYHEKSLTIARDANDQKGIAIALDGIGTVYAVQRQYPAALSALSESLSINRSIDYKKGEVNNLNHLGLLAVQQQDFPTALDYYGQSLTLAQATNFLEGETRALMGHGFAYHRQADYAESLSYNQQALMLSRQLNKPLLVFLSLKNTAINYLRLEQYEAAADAYRQSWELVKAFHNEREKAHISEQLGTTYLKLENYSEALGYYQQSLSIRQSMPERIANRSKEAQALKNIGFVYNKLEAYDQAIEFYKSSLAIAQSLNQTDDVSHTLLLLGVSYGHNEEYIEAIDYYRQSVDLLPPERKKSVLYTLERTLTRAKRTYIQREKIEPTEMLAILEGALALYEATGIDETFSDLFIDDSVELGATTVGIRSVVGPLAKMHWELGNFDQAISFLERESSIREKNMIENLGFSGTSVALSGLDITTSSYELNASVTAFVDNLTDSDTVAELSLLTILRRKGRTLEGLVAHSQRHLSGADERSKELLAALRDKSTLLSNLYFNGDSFSDEDYEAREKEIKAEITEIEKELEEIGEAAAQQSNQQFSEIVSTKAVRELIPTEAALIELVTYRPYEVTGFLSRFTEPRYAAYILTREGEIQAVDLGASAVINQQVAQYRKALKNRSANIDQISKQLSELVIAPIRPLIGDKTQLLIAPDDQLNVIPFEALVDEQGRYLIEAYQISYLSSGRDLIGFQRADSQGNTEGVRSPVIIANPDYASPAERSTDLSSIDTETVPISSNPNSNSNVNLRAVEVDKLTFSALPGTAVEADKISTFLPDATVLTQQQATESAIKKIASPSILHIATHGFFLPDVPSAQNGDSRGGLGASFDIVDGTSTGDLLPVDIATENALLRSGLALAGVNVRSSGGDRITEDGIFTALEAANLNLNGTQLVVLSACETGVGTISDEDGVYGLRRAFAIAGAESQLMSLWQVDDIGTSELMALYYENLIEKKQGRSEALRNAQLELLNTGTYQHPYYWSSFIFSGDWAPLE